MLSNEDNFTALVKQNRSIAEKVRDFFADFIEKIKNALTRLAKNNAEYSALQNDTEAKEKILAMFNKALESSQNNNTAENSSAKYALKEYSQHQIDNWKNSKRIVVYESQNQLQQFIDNAREHKNLNKKIYFGIISDETADFIKQNTGVDVSNCNVSLRADSIIKIFNDHGTEVTELPRGQRPITDQDILKLPQLLGSIDYAVNAGVYTGMGKDGNSTFLNLRSNLDDSITIGAFKQGKYLDLRIHTMYAKRGNYATTADANAPASTSKTRSGKVSSNNTVPQNDTVVNNHDIQNEQKYSLKTDSDGNELSEQQQEYFKDSKVRDEDGHLLVMYHGTPNAGFTRFRLGSYFTQNRNYADRYQYPGASSLSVKTTENNPNTYKVYLNIQKPFDTRNPAEREIFENEFYMKWGNGSPLSDRGLPDWVEAMDLQEFIEENGYDYDGLILDEGADGGYGMPVVDRGISFVTFNSNQVKNIDNKNPTDDDDIRFSMKETADYSYKSLVSKPDMSVTVINDQKDYTPGKSTRENVVDEAQRSALSVGRKDSSGNVYVYVNDTDTEVMLSKRGLRHSLDRRLSIIAPVTENIGPIIKNSIRINELSPEFETIKNSYVLIGIAKNQKNEPYVVSFVVNRASNEVMSVDVLYAVNAKTEPAGSLSPELSSQRDVSLTGSTVSISDLLDYVNRYYPDILPEDVLRHYGYTARPDGVIGESALYSLKEEDNTSIFEDNEELAESAENVQNMLRFVATENNELRKAFDIRTVRQVYTYKH